MSIREIEGRSEALLKSIARDERLKSAVNSGSRAEQLRRQREIKQKSVLDQAVERLMMRHELAVRQQCEQKLRADFESQHDAMLRAEMRKHSITSSSHVIKDLEKKLSNAYMNQERSNQINQKHLINAKEKQQNELWESQSRSKLAILNELEKQREINAMQHGVDYQRALEAQLEELEEKKRLDYMQFLDEKRMVDEVVEKICEEDSREQEMRLLKQKETKRFVEEYITQRHQWRKQEQERIKGENKKIAEHANLQLKRDEEESCRKKNSNEKRDIIYDKLAADMERKEAEKRELEDLRLELNKEEEGDAARQRDQATLKSRIRKRLELIQAYHDQIDEKRARSTKDREDEDVYRKRLLDQFAKDERIELMNAQKRRMKQLDHKRAVESLVNERNRLIDEEAAADYAMDVREAELQNYRDEVIEQERQRLLQEHAGALAGFLPKGVFRDKNDLDLFDQEFKRNFLGSA